MAKFEIPVVLDSTFIKKAVRGVTASAEFNETTSDDYKKGFFDFAEALINTLEKISKSDAECSEWISTKEELPEKCCEYLVCIKDKHYMVLQYSPEHKKFNAFDGQSERVVRDCAIEVSHWMPLPEPPKERY
jgi:hypothetical protein